MKLMVINPNTSAGMPRAIERAARQVCRPDTELWVTQPAEGVASIEGNADGAIAAYEVMRLVRDAPHADGYVIACFDDTGLHAARELVAGPVVGIGEAALHAASLIAARFSVLTTLQRSVVILEQNAQRYGFSGRTFRIHASGIAVLDLEHEASYRQLLARAREAIAADAAECLVLGCGGMSAWSARLSADLGLPVVDGVQAAVTLVEALLAQNLRTSKRISYAAPERK